MSGDPRVLQGPWTPANPLPVVQVAGPPPNVQGYYPPTVANPLPVYIVTLAGAETGEVRQIIEDAPHDGRVYARKNGEWVPIGVQS